MNAGHCPPNKLAVVLDLDGTIADFSRGRWLRPHMPRLVSGIVQTQQADICGVATERPDIDILKLLSRLQVEGALPDIEERCRSVSHFGIGDRKAAALLELAAVRSEGKNPNRLGADLAVIDNLPHRLLANMLKVSLAMDIPEASPLNISVGVPPAFGGKYVISERLGRTRDSLFDHVRENGGIVRGFEDTPFGASDGGVTVGGLRIMVTRVGDSRRECGPADGALFVENSLNMVHILDSWQVNTGMVEQRRRQGNRDPLMPPRF